MTERFLVCLPMGGFNDALNQIWRCVSYSKKTNRVMLLDTNYCGLSDDIRNYFDLDLGCEVGCLSDIGLQIKISPNFLELYDGYNQKYALDENNTIKRQILSDSDEKFRVHFAYGGGDLGIKALERMKPNRNTQDNIFKRLKVFDQNYVAIHIRNTDMKTSYRAAFNALEKHFLNKRVLLCSDDQNIVDYFIKKYSFYCEIFITCTKRNTDGSTLHLSSKTNVQMTNYEMLTDLYSLAFAERFFFVDNIHGSRSGFSVLAAHMLRRLNGIGTPLPFDWRSRGQVFMQSMKKRNFFRIWRARQVNYFGGQKFLVHPTYE